MNGLSRAPRPGFALRHSRRFVTTCGVWIAAAVLELSDRIEVVPADKRSGTRADGDLARYFSFAGAQAADENTGDLIPVAEVRPRLRLLAGAPPSRYTALPLLAIRMEGDACVLDEYVPQQLARRVEPRFHGFLGKLKNVTHVLVA